VITPGILQGRLSAAPAGRPQAFPWATWRQEFADAARLGVGTLEWLVTAERPQHNPIWTTAGIEDIRRVAAANRVTVTSVCADFLIPLPLIGVSADERTTRVGMLEHLTRQCPALAARVIVLPLLEANAPADERQFAEVMGAIDPVLHLAAGLNISIALESGWTGARLRAALGSVGAPATAVCYDIGNAAAFGLDAAADLRALGTLVAAVHVKDRRRSGESVPLGTGDADLEGAFAALSAIGYSGTAVLETPAGPQPVAAASRNLGVLHALLPRSAAAST
jgi:hexulose-6-phosphate isomerase